MNGSEIWACYNPNTEEDAIEMLKQREGAIVVKCNWSDNPWFTERLAKEREAVETYWHDPKTMDEWVERELAYYSDAKLTDKEVEVLTTTERIQRIMEADRRLTSQIRKDNDEDSQE